MWAQTYSAESSVQQSQFNWDQLPLSSESAGVC